MAPLLVCPRGCGRTFRTAAGQKWHIENFNYCAARNPSPNQSTLALSDAERETEILNAHHQALYGPVDHSDENAADEKQVASLAREAIARADNAYLFDHVTRTALNAREIREEPIPPDWLSARMRNGLLRKRLYRIGDLATLTRDEVSRWPGIGAGTIAETIASVTSAVGQPARANSTTVPPHSPSDYLFGTEVRAVLANFIHGTTPIERSWFIGPGGARVYNELASRGLVTFSAVEPLTISEVASWPNVGRRSIFALVRTISERALRAAFSASSAAPSHSTLRAAIDLDSTLAGIEEILQVVSARDVRFGRPIYPDIPLAQLLTRPALRAAEVDDLRGRLVKLANIVRHPQVLLVELDDLLGKSGRNAEIAKARWGWSGEGPKTLEEVGESYSVTRERIRQIIRKVAANAFQGRPAYLPTSQAILLLASELGGAVFENDLGQVAYERGLVDSPRDVSALWSLPELGLLPASSFAHLQDRSGDVVIGADSHEVSEFASIGRIVRRELSRRGIVGIAELRGAIEAEGIPVSDGEILAYLNRAKDVAPVASGAYYWRPTDADSPFMAVIRRPLVLVGPQTAQALQRAVRRAQARRPEYGARVPLETLKQALAASPYIRITDGLHEWTGPTDKVAFGDVERAIMEVLQREGPAATFSTIRKHIVQLGIKPVTMSLYLSTSPLFDQSGRGMYHLLGADLMPSDIELARRLSPKSRYRR